MTKQITNPEQQSNPVEQSPLLHAVDHLKTYLEEQPSNHDEKSWCREMINIVTGIRDLLAQEINKDDIVSTANQHLEDVNWHYLTNESQQLVTDLQQLIAHLESPNVSDDKSPAMLTPDQLRSTIYGLGFELVARIIQHHNNYDQLSPNG
jgi:hypothetical protein